MKNVTVVTASLLLILPITLFPLIPSLPDTEANDTCQALADLHIEDTNLLSATIVPASGDLPEYCRVLGYVRPAINFEIRLPTSSWNGKFYMAGCGGFCGKLESETPATQFFNSINYGLRREYAVSTTDGGHWGPAWFDGRWAYHNRQAEIDWGHRAVHETARVTKTIINAYYDRPPEQSYFQGCSNGGRQAVMEAWRYPEDFDGIISGAPAIDNTKLLVFMSWLTNFNTGPDGKNLITQAEVSLLRESVYRACDGHDGLEDGLISDPTTCTFDPESLACTGENMTSCLTPEQIEVVTAFYSGPINSSGERLYPEGIPHGSEPNWMRWITGNTEYADDDRVLILSNNFFRYMAFENDPGDTFSIAEFDFDKDPQRLGYMAQFYNSDNPDLETFRDRGGKLLMWHGLADPIVPPQKTIDYYEAVEIAVGSREATQEFMQLYVIPGMDHCGIGDEPGITDSGFDPLTALEQWVEHEEAPKSLLATKTDTIGNVLWTRPLCPYPLQAKFKGQGDFREASNYECASPE